MTTSDGAATTWRRRAVLVGTVAAVMLLGGGCSRGTTSRSLPTATGDDVGAAVAKMSDAGAGLADTAASDERSEAAAVGALVPAELGRDRVVKTASIDIEVAKGGFAAAFSKVPSIASANGGFVASSDSLQAGDGDRQSAGTLVVRVPAESFDRTREQLVLWASCNRSIWTAPASAVS